MAADNFLVPGNRVMIEEDVEGVIERVSWSRGMTWPIYLVEYWHEGCVHSQEFHHPDVSPL